MASNWTDFSHQVKIHRNGKIRALLIFGGSLSFALGVVGIFVPILPTTPFLLLSALCYARSSVRFYNLLLNNRYFGKYIQDWRTNGTISFRTKIFALITLFLTLGSSIVFFIPFVPVKVTAGFIGVLISIYIVKIPTRS